MIRALIQKVNKTFFFPQFLQLQLLKDCPQTIPVLTQWLFDEWHSYDASLTKEKLIASFNKRLHDDKIPVTFVVTKEAQPVGVISLKYKSEPEFSDFPEDSLWLGSLQVVAKERNHGIGQTLLKFITKVAQLFDHKEMYLYTSNPLNIAWYLKCGAVVVMTRSFRHHEVTIMKMTFQK